MCTQKGASVTFRRFTYEGVTFDLSFESVSQDQVDIDYDNSAVGNTPLTHLWYLLDSNVQDAIERACAESIAAERQFDRYEDRVLRAAEEFRGDMGVLA